MPQGLKTLITGSSGGEKKLRNARPTGFTSPGLSGAYNKKTRSFDVTRSSALTQGLADLQSRLGERASAFRGLRGSDIFDKLLEGRVGAIRDAGLRTVGNLRQELGKRRVAGSSFAEREISSTEAMFAREEKIAHAEGRRDQLSAEASLIDQEFQASVQAAQVMIDQMNMESGLGAQLGQFASAQMFERARLRAELDTSIEGAQIEWMAMERAMAHDFFMSMMENGGGMMGGMGGMGG